MKKRLFRFRNFDNKEVDQANRDIDDLYKYKPEMVNHKNSASASIFAGFQEIEHGKASIDTSTATSTLTFNLGLSNNYDSVFNVQLEPIISSPFNLYLTGITGSSISINLSAASGLGSVREFYWVVIGSRE